MKRPSSHGGYRPGAGRKSGSGVYGEPTARLSIPQSRLATVRGYLEQCRQGKRASLPAANDELLLPLIGRVAAGQPIGADAHVEREIAIDRFLFRPKPDYLLRVFGFSMINAGILDQDLIAVHRTAEARNGQIVVARIEGEITVKTFEQTRSGIFLLPANDDYEPIKINSRTDDFAIEGIHVGLVRGA